MYSSVMDAIGFVLVATVLFGFAVWLGVYFAYETILRLVSGKAPQERSLDGDQVLQDENDFKARQRPDRAA